MRYGEYYASSLIPRPSLPTTLNRPQHDNDGSGFLGPFSAVRRCERGLHTLHLLLMVRGALPNRGTARGKAGGQGVVSIEAEEAAQGHWERSSLGDGVRSVPRRDRERATG